MRSLAFYPCTTLALHLVFAQRIVRSEKYNFATIWIQQSRAPECAPLSWDLAFLPDIRTTDCSLQYTLLSSHLNSTLSSSRMRSAVMVLGFPSWYNLELLRWVETHCPSSWLAEYCFGTRYSDQIAPWIRTVVQAVRSKWMSTQSCCLCIRMHIGCVHDLFGHALTPGHQDVSQIGPSSPKKNVL